MPVGRRDRICESCKSISNCRRWNDWAVDDWGRCAYFVKKMEVEKEIKVTKSSDNNYSWLGTESDHGGMRTTMPGSRF